jgi:hypothetical protein
MPAYGAGAKPPTGCDAKNLREQMNLSDEEIQEIIKNNCGTPPQRKLVEYHIWVNQSKLNFYTKNPFYKGLEQQEALDSYRGLIKAGIELLNSLPS